MMNMKRSLRVSKWGNSKAIRLPVEMVKAAQIKDGDNLEAQLVENPNGSRSFVFEIIPENQEIPKTIDELFNGYDGGSFQAEVQEMRAVGNEAW
ncbi:AbrB/MazE/SpoVT family DNA-binding domain-containing protein [Lactococcus garvieae]|uniref:AbrB/MazE/SpoVT family DNA-binding domain-containing protein n=1 Tax=Lactococcus garvieae TaxID=1363 RepID=UPI003851C976